MWEQHRQLERAHQPCEEFVEYSHEIDRHVYFFDLFEDSTTFTIFDPRLFLHDKRGGVAQLDRQRWVLPRFREGLLVEGMPHEGLPRLFLSVVCRQICPSSYEIFGNRSGHCAGWEVPDLRSLAVKIRRGSELQMHAKFVENAVNYSMFYRNQPLSQGRPLTNACPNCQLGQNVTPIKIDTS